MTRNAKDVVCGMKVDKETRHRHKFNGTPQYFCSEACLDRFRSDPWGYLGDTDE